MRTLIVSDIHSNLEALDAVLAHAARQGGFDRIWCLGDLVGYGPDPSACLGLLREFDLVAVAGNHDYAAAGVIDSSDFNGAAYAAIQWTAEQLAADDKSFLAGLPMVSQQPPFTLVHGSLRDPIVEYLTHPSQALATLELLTTPYCLVGHSHYPFICRENAGRPLFKALPDGQPVALDGERCIVNPGSVGQPRDSDPRSGYAVFDSDGPSVEHFRVEYDIARTQNKMRSASLPQYLIDRLDYGA